MLAQLVWVVLFTVLSPDVNCTCAFRLCWCFRGGLGLGKIWRGGWGWGAEWLLREENPVAGVIGGEACHQFSQLVADCWGVSTIIISITLLWLGAIWLKIKFSDCFRAHMTINSKVFFIERVVIFEVNVWYVQHSLGQHNQRMEDNWLTLHMCHQKIKQRKGRHT